MNKLLSPFSAEEEPVFGEPWEAQVFSLVAALVDGGTISSAEWSQALGAAIREAQQEGDPDTGDTYYQHWLRALENLLQTKNLALNEELHALVQAWREAYLATPHGQPVELTART